MPDPQKILTTVRRARDLCLSTPGLEGSVVHPPAIDDVFVVGDLHGNLAAFSQVLREADLARHPRRHLVFQEVIHGPHEYPDDGGDKSHQLLDLVAALKCQYPDRIHLILGNHELSERTGRSISKNGVYLNELFRRGIDTAYRERAEEIYRAYLDLFAALPVALRTPNRVFVCHTLPHGHELDTLDFSPLRTGAWPPDALKRGGALYALTWGRDGSLQAAERFAALVDADLFVTGHMPCEAGFQLANPRQLIIDGTDPHPCYCRINAQEPATVEALLDGVRLLPLALGGAPRRRDDDQ